MMGSCSRRLEISNETNEDLNWDVDENWDPVWRHQSNAVADDLLAIKAVDYKWSSGGSWSSMF